MAALSYPAQCLLNKEVCHCVTVLLVSTCTMMTNLIQTDQLAGLSLPDNRDMAECTGRRQKKKKQKNMDQRNAGSLSTEHAEFSDKDILKYLIAAQSNDVDTVLRFLQCGMPVDTECLMFSDTALIKACRMGSVEAAQLLLDWGADIATRTGNNTDGLLDHLTHDGHKHLKTL